MWAIADIIIKRSVVSNLFVYFLSSPATQDAEHLFVSSLNEAQVDSMTVTRLSTAMCPVYMAEEQHMTKKPYREVIGALL